MLLCCLLFSTAVVSLVAPLREQIPSLQVPPSGKMRYTSTYLLTLASKDEAVPTEELSMPTVRSIQKFTKSQSSQDSRWFRNGQ